MNLERRVVINKDSIDKDCSGLTDRPYYVAFGGVVIWPITIAGKRECDLGKHGLAEELEEGE